MAQRRQHDVELLLLVTVDAARDVLFLSHGALADLNGTNIRQILKPTGIRLEIIG